MGEEKRPPKARVFEVSSVEELKNLLESMGLNIADGKIEIQGARATNIPGMRGTMVELAGGPVLEAESAIAGALTALHRAAHDLLVAGGCMPSEKEVGELTAKLLAQGLKKYITEGPPSDAERDAFNEEWDRQANVIAPPSETCPCPRCRKARGE
jgi:hypothetical protein